MDLQKRKKFFYKKSTEKNFTDYINEIIYLCIPKNYLENYKNIKNSLNKSYWPKNVKTILSAYDFLHDDVYKIWAAERVSNNKATYLIHQHGGNSGLAESSPGTDLQCLLSDKYLTWGWKGKYKNNVPFHSISLSNQSLNLKKNRKKYIFALLNIHGLHTDMKVYQERILIELKKKSLYFK